MAYPRLLSHAKETVSECLAAKLEHIEEPGIHRRPLVAQATTPVVAHSPKNEEEAGDHASGRGTSLAMGQDRSDATRRKKSMVFRRVASQATTGRALDTKMAEW